MYRVPPSCQCHIPESPTPLLIPCLMIPMPNLSCPMTIRQPTVQSLSSFTTYEISSSIVWPSWSFSIPPSPPPHIPHPIRHGMAWHHIAWHRSCSYRVQRRTKLEPCRGPAMAQRSSVSLPRPPHHTRTTSSSDDSS